MSDTLNLLTVDLEEWFVAEALSSHLERDAWDQLESTVEKNSHRLLELFAKKKVHATWFVLGWCADRYPDLISDIFRAGHEVACHSYYHRRVDLMQPDEFREDTVMAIDAIVKAIGNRPFGYRAPSWSINVKNPWAFEILGELGFQYDSSIFPIKHDFYGVPGGPRKPFRMRLKQGGELYEVPASTTRTFGKNLPAAGGGYFRHSPYWYSARVIRQINREGLPTVVYVHPWELDPDPPNTGSLSLIQRFRTYGSTSMIQYKIEKLLSEFRFTTISDYLGLFEKKKIGFDRH